MPTLQNTHLQTAPSQPASQSLQESIFYPNPTEIKNNKSPLFQKIKLIRLTNRYKTTTKKKALGGNSVYVQ